MDAEFCIPKTRPAHPCVAGCCKTVPGHQSDCHRWHLTFALSTITRLVQYNTNSCLTFSTSFLLCGLLAEAQTSQHWPLLCLAHSAPCSPMSTQFHQKSYKKTFQKPPESQTNCLPWYTPIYPWTHFFTPSGTTNFSNLSGWFMEGNLQSVPNGSLAELYHRFTFRLLCSTK